jgi:hypothetical protein
MERMAWRGMWPGGPFVRTVWFGPESRSCMVALPVGFLYDVVELLEGLSVRL